MEPSVKMKKPKDLEHINAIDIDELLWWSVQLSVSPEKLLAIIAKRGSSVMAVKNATENKNNGKHLM
jgi:hypothetical protein